MTESSMLRDHLRAIGDVPLPEALWKKLDKRRVQILRRRKVVFSAVTFVLVVTAGSFLSLQDLQRADTDSSKKTLAVQASALAPEVQAQVRALDQALQAAYDRGASDAEIAPMWAARTALLAELQQTSASPQSGAI